MSEEAKFYKPSGIQPTTATPRIFPYTELSETIQDHVLPAPFFSLTVIHEECSPV